MDGGMRRERNGEQRKGVGVVFIQIPVAVFG